MAMRATTRTLRRVTAPASARTSSSSILGVRTSTAQDLRKRIEAGFSYVTLTRLQEAIALPMPSLAELVQIPTRTLARRKSAGKLAPDESERVFRIASVLAKAEALFEGDRAAALAWLTQPNRALGDERPLDVARTEVGAREVEDLIGRLEHGVFS
jgi:putative toxin-antitoxin system antitoxin component (TIGR02293 family)